MPFISLRDVRFRYKNAQEEVLKGIDLQIGKGEVVFLMGPSGAGKSTLCACLNGLIPHLIRGDFQGEVEIAGKKTRDVPVKEFAPYVGLVFQDFEAQLFCTTVELEAAFGPENLGLDREELKLRVQEALDSVRMGRFRKRQPANLSGGEKQRLALASVLAMRPGTLVLDEPTTDLDPLGKSELLQAVRALREKQGMTLLMVEHETEEALGADRVLLMDQGKIVAQGSPLEVLRDGKALAELGVRPLEMMELSSRLKAPVTWTTPEEAQQGIQSMGLGVSKEAYGKLQERDRGREYGEVVLEVSGVSYGYEKGTPALKDVSFKVRRGEFLAIVGQNGSGKTTLIKHLNGLLKPQSGRVLMNGKDIRKEKPSQLSRKVGLVFQNPDHQIFAERVWDEAAFGPSLQGLSPKEVGERVEQTLQAVGLLEAKDEDPFVLTKGSRQRLAVASVLATQPEVIVLDEPTTGLDFRELASMMELIRGLNETGHTILMVTHSMPLVAAQAQRTVVMKEGRILKDGPTREVFSDPASLQEAFLTLPPVVSLSQRLGFTALTVDEFIGCLSKGI